VVFSQSHAASTALLTHCETRRAEAFFVNPSRGELERQFAEIALDGVVVARLAGVQIAGVCLRFTHFALLWFLDLKRFEVAALSALEQEARTGSCLPPAPCSI
jgi:hypothetical protein